METYNFVLFLGKIAHNSELEDKVYECGCNDALLYSCKGECFLEFDREANSFEEAVNSAILDLTGAGLSVIIEIENVEDL